MNGSSLLALCLLVCTGPVLGCEWDPSSYPEHGLTFLVLQSGSVRSCLDDCCDQLNCSLVLFGFPTDRRPPCQLVDCSKNWSLCAIKPSALLKVYRKKGPRPDGRSEAEGGGKLPAAPGIGTGNGTGTNETNNKRSQDGLSKSEPSSAKPALHQNTDLTPDEFAERCGAERQVGPCRAAFQRWYFNSKTGSCEPFIYGGCNGNQNNYDSKEVCMTTCAVLPSSKRADPSVEYRDKCMVTSDPGPCRAAFPMFYYDQNTGSCQSFVYGGCHGNQNRYSSVEECMSRCSRGASIDTHGPARDRWTPAIFLFVTLTAISALLLAALVIITLRRHRLPRRLSSVSDKEELLPDPDEQSSLESLTIPESPKLG